MAEVHSSNHEGIKLFGTMIKLQNRIKEEPEKADELNQTDIKKPDKIIACPRCKSMETKFCYFNNYNVNQPRHFCKACQRYWTAGGALRNVPIGAGRRRTKPPICRSFASDDYQLYHTSGVIHQLELDGWKVTVADEDFRRDFPPKRQKISGQTP